MALYDDLLSDVVNIIGAQWDIRDGTVVPDTEDVKLTGGGVRLDATMLYADLADSTELAAGYDSRVVAKLYKSFLACSSRLIRANGGVIRSFDGDRVMGIFVGNGKNSAAAKCALQTKYTFTEIIVPKFEATYPTLTSQYALSHGVGIDTGAVFAVRAGVRNSNDLVWIGRAPNVAAKLSARRDGSYRSFITPDVYNMLNEASKLASGVDMWSAVSVSGLPGISTIYRSSYHWKP